MGTASPLDARLTRMSLEEWAALPEDEPGELVDVTDGLITTVPGCEGLQIDVAALWREVDELPSET